MKLPTKAGEDHVLIRLDHRPANSIPAGGILASADGVKKTPLPDADAGQVDPFFALLNVPYVIGGPRILLRQQNAAKTHRDQVSFYDPATEATISLNTPPLAACP